MNSDPFFVRTLEQVTGPASGYLQTLDAQSGAGSGTGTGVTLDLGVGEARFPIPPVVRSELGDSVFQLDQVGYTDPAGEETLRGMYLRHLQGGQHNDAGSVLVTAGGKEAAWLAIRYLLIGQLGGALVPVPGWEPYSLWLHALGRSVVPYDPAVLADDPSYLRDLVSSAPQRPSLLVLNYPHNPTGVFVGQRDMDRIIELAAELDLAVVSDEVYRAFAPGHVSAAFAPAFGLRHVVVDSTSKWLASAGLRVGFVYADAQIVRALTAIRATYASCTSGVTQRLAGALLSSLSAGRWLDGVRTEVGHAVQAVAKHLAGAGVQVVSSGGLYVWCRTPDAWALPPAPVADAEPVRARFVDGAGFGAPGHLRICPARAGVDPKAAAAAVVATLQRQAAHA